MTPRGRLAPVVVVAAFAFASPHTLAETTIQLGEHNEAGGLELLEQADIAVRGEAKSRVTVMRCIDPPCTSRELFQLRQGAEVEPLSFPRVPQARDRFRIERGDKSALARTTAREPSADIVVAVLGDVLMPTAALEVARSGAVVASRPVRFVSTTVSDTGSLFGYDAAVVAPGHVPVGLEETALMRFVRYGGVVLADASFAAAHAPQTERMRAFTKVFVDEASPKKDNGRVFVERGTLSVDGVRVPLKDALDASVEIVPSGGGAFVARSEGAGTTASIAALLSVMPLRIDKSERTLEPVLQWVQQTLFAKSVRMLNIQRAFFILGVLLLTLAFAFFSMRKQGNKMVPALVAASCAALSLGAAFNLDRVLPRDVLQLPPSRLDVTVAVGSRSASDGAAHRFRFARYALRDIDGEGAPVLPAGAEATAVLAGRLGAMVERTGAGALAAWSSVGDIITARAQVAPRAERLAFYRHATDPQGPNAAAPAAAAPKAAPEAGDAPTSLHVNLKRAPDALFARVRGSDGKPHVVARSTDSAGTGVFALSAFDADYPATTTALKAARVLAATCPGRVFDDVDCAIAIEAEDDVWRIYIALPGARYVDGE